MLWGEEDRVVCGRYKDANISKYKARKHPELSEYFNGYIKLLKVKN